MLLRIFLSVLPHGGGIGASVIVSRYFGAKEYGRMKTAVFTALLSFLGISLVLGIAGLILGADHGMVEYPGRLSGYGVRVSADLFPGAAVFVYV